MIKRLTALLVLFVCLSVPVFGGDIPSTPAPPPPAPEGSTSTTESVLIAILLSVIAIR
jgi:hypothetical protein